VGSTPSFRTISTFFVFRQFMAGRSLRLPPRRFGSQDRKIAAVHEPLQMLFDLGFSNFAI
jgi:hypothetical protein